MYEVTNGCESFVGYLRHIYIYIYLNIYNICFESRLEIVVLVHGCIYSALAPYSKQTTLTFRYVGGKWYSLSIFLYSCALKRSLNSATRYFNFRTDHVTIEPVNRKFGFYNDLYLYQYYILYYYRSNHREMCALHLRDRQFSGFCWFFFR